MSIPFKINEFTTTSGVTESVMKIVSLCLVLVFYRDTLYTTDYLTRVVGNLEFKQLGQEKKDFAKRKKLKD